MVYFDHKLQGRFLLKKILCQKNSFNSRLPSQNSYFSRVYRDCDSKREKPFINSRSQHLSIWNFITQL